MSDSLQTVKQFIQDRNPGVGEFGPDDDLIERRAVDSAAFVDLVLLLEDLGGTPIDPAELQIDDFRTLRRIDEKFLGGVAA